MKKVLISSLVAVISISLFQSPSFAVGSDGFTNATLSAKSISMGFTGVARADDPALAWFNPSAAAFLGHSAIQFGVSPISFDSKFTGTNGTSDSMDSSFAIPAYLYSVLPLGDKLAFSFSMNSPFGLQTKWSDSSPVRYDATESKLLHIQLNPSLAYKLTDNFSLGAGIVYAYSDATLKKKIDVTTLNGGLTSPDGESNMSADGDGWGYNLAMFFKPAENQQVGVNYRSRIKQTLEGTTEINGFSGPITGAPFNVPANNSADTKASVPLPESLTLGYSIELKKWTVEADAEYAGWGSFDGIALDFSGTNANNEGLYAAGKYQDFDYHNTWNFGLGTNYKLNDTWDLRGGLVHYDQVGPDKTFSPSIPGGERNGLTLGFGFNRPSYCIDFAYDYTVAKDRVISSDEANFATEGKYETKIHALSLAYTYKWGGK